MMRSVIRWAASAIVGALIGLALGVPWCGMLWRLPMPPGQEQPQWGIAVIEAVLLTAKIGLVSGGVGGLAFAGLRQAGARRAVAGIVASAVFAGAVAVCLATVALWPQARLR